MKLASSTVVAGALLAAATALVPSVAAAQPGAAPPPPPPPGYGPPPAGGYYTAPTTDAQGFQLRAGRLAIGFGLTVGAMDAESGPIECPSCDYGTAAGSFDFHIGGMLSNRLAILFEAQATGQTVEVYDNGDYIEGVKSLTQGAILGAAQFWVTPRIWVKGGLGLASLSYQYDDSYDSYEEEIDAGVAVLAAAGVELLHRRGLALDLQGRILVGSYDAIDDQITSATFGLGLSFY